MTAEVKVKQILEQIMTPLSIDGSKAELVGFDGTTVKVRYETGQNDDCETCVMTPDDFRDFFAAALRNSVPEVNDVVLE